MQKFSIATFIKVIKVARIFNSVGSRNLCPFCVVGGPARRTFDWVAKSFCAIRGPASMTGTYLKICEESKKLRN